MLQLICIFLCLVFQLALPVNAAETTAATVPTETIPVTEYTTVPTEAVTVPTETEEVTEPTEVLETAPPAVEYEAVVIDVNGGLAGGYYFVCDCALGNGLKFYVPIEWAHDAFTLDSSGAPVNISVDTCYAFCPDFPDYTFSCSRFGTFTYRSSNYNTSDLQITNISDSNIGFLEDETPRLSIQELLYVLCCLVFLILVLPRVLRR